jgi:hypothetical protein
VKICRQGEEICRQGEEVKICRQGEEGNLCRHGEEACAGGEEEVATSSHELGGTCTSVLGESHTSEAESADTRPHNRSSWSPLLE